ncbi:hypothetical protein RhiirC2_858433 [Rhizophagus irregularis]|uniref:KIF21A/B second helical domain-containing protein n=1 Tax=Rhizophagus irregularis TaxID=588596 RepID=A0A2N1M5G6_9GLOM|nr:hypothetical protein RhiirC2_858433 [Rhizophagus irregularis]
MLHQIQVDMVVKEQLVSQLECAEQEYINMRAQYEQKLADMQDALITLQQERNAAIKRAQNASTGVSTRDKNSILAELKTRYEHKMKRLIQEIGELRRKYNEATQSNTTSRDRNETILKSMRAQIEQLKSEKMQMMKRMKDEAKRVREMTEHNQREIQNLRRKEKSAQEQKKPIYKYISGRQTLTMMDDWIVNRNNLQEEKNELLEEREKIITSEVGNELGGDVQALDDKIEMITSEIAYINAKIHSLQSSIAAKQEEKSAENSKESEDKSRKNSIKSSKIEKKLSFILLYELYNIIAKFTLIAITNAKGNRKENIKEKYREKENFNQQKHHSSVASVSSGYPGGVEDREASELKVQA